MGNILKEKNLKRYLQDKSSKHYNPKAQEFIEIWETSPGLNYFTSLHDFLVSQNVYTRSAMDGLLLEIPFDPMLRSPGLPFLSYIEKNTSYKIVENFASGGMGSIYKVLDQHTKIFYALKILLPPVSSDHFPVEEIQYRFQKEAQIISRLSHPNIIKCKNIFSCQNQIAIFLEWIEGPNLSQWIKKYGTLDEWKTIDLAIAIAQAIAYYEPLSLVHRDIKPANILFPIGSQPKLADFGLAKILNEEESQKTRDGEPLGSFSYCSMEQARGDWKLLDIRSDIYSLGASLFFCLLGEEPFPARTWFEVCEQFQKNKRILAFKKSNLNISQKTSDTLLKMIANEPQDRYQSAKELLADLLSLREWQTLRFHSDKSKNMDILTQMESKEGMIAKSYLEYVVYSAKGKRLALVRKMGDEFYLKADSPFCVGTVTTMGEKKNFCSLTIPGNIWYPVLPEDWINLKNSDENTWFTILKYYSSSKKSSDTWELKILDSEESYKIRISKQNTLQLFPSDVALPEAEEEKIDIDILSTLKEEEQSLYSGKILPEKDLKVEIIQTFSEDHTHIEKKFTPKNEIIIGRNPDCCDLVIKLPFKSQQDLNYIKMWKISKRHLALIVKNRELYAMDMESTRGSSINQTPMKPKELYRVNGLCQILLGDVTLQLKPISH